MHVALGALQRGYLNDACTRQSTQMVMNELMHIKGVFCARRRSPLRPLRGSGAQARSLLLQNASPCASPKLCPLRRLHWARSQLGPWRG